MDMFEFFFEKKVQFYSNKEPKIEEEKKPVDFFKSFSIQVKIVSSFKKMVSVTYLTFLLLQKAWKKSVIMNTREGFSHKFFFIFQHFLNDDDDGIKMGRILMKK